MLKKRCLFVCHSFACPLRMQMILHSCRLINLPIDLALLGTHPSRVPLYAEILPPQRFELPLLMMHLGNNPDVYSAVLFQSLDLAARYAYQIREMSQQYRIFADSSGLLSADPVIQEISRHRLDTYKSLYPLLDGLVTTAESEAYHLPDDLPSIALESIIEPPNPEGRKDRPGEPVFSLDFVLPEEKDELFHFLSEVAPKILSNSPGITFALPTACSFADELLQDHVLKEKVVLETPGLPAQSSIHIAPSQMFLGERTVCLQALQSGVPVIGSYPCLTGLDLANPRLSLANHPEALANAVALSLESLTHDAPKERVERGLACMDSHQKKLQSLLRAAGL